MTDQPRHSEGVTCPDGFDQADIDYATTLVPDGAFVTEMGTIVGWMTPDGDYDWRFYAAEGGDRMSSMLGLIEMSKHNLLLRNTNLRRLMAQQELDDDDED